MATAPDMILLREQLAKAVADQTLPAMLRNLLRAAQVELSSWAEGHSGRGFEIASHAVSEWKRWTSAHETQRRP